VNRASLDEQNRILNDPTLTADQKAQQLKALEQKQQLASDQILGVPPPAPAAVAPPLPPVPQPAQVDIHPYSPGETIDQIAAQYGVTPAAILNANPNLNFNNLSRGTGINIPRPLSQ
jgi:LysM repeat protein